MSKISKFFISLLVILIIAVTAGVLVYFFVSNVKSAADKKSINLQLNEIFSKKGFEDSKGNIIALSTNKNEIGGIQFTDMKTTFLFNNLDLFESKKNEKAAIIQLSFTEDGKVSSIDMSKLNIKSYFDSISNASNNIELLASDNENTNKFKNPYFDALKNSSIPLRQCNLFINTTSSEISSTEGFLAYSLLRKDITKNEFYYEIKVIQLKNDIAYDKVMELKNKLIESEKKAYADLKLILDNISSTYGKTTEFTTEKINLNDYLSSTKYSSLDYLTATYNAAALTNVATLIANKDKEFADKLNAHNVAYEKNKKSIIFNKLFTFYESTIFSKDEVKKYKFNDLEINKIKTNEFAYLISPIDDKEKDKIYISNNNTFFSIESTDSFLNIEMTFKSKVRVM